MSINYEFDWAELAFGSKKPLRQLAATFIAAPRKLSAARLKQLIKTSLPKGNIVLGISKAEHVEGFHDQPQFRTLQLAEVANLVAKVNAASPHKIYTLSYAASDEPHIIAKDLFARYVFINGSWQYSFHLKPSFFALAKLKVNYELVSPFTDETEAKAYLQRVWPEVEQAALLPPAGTVLTAVQALELAATTGRRSFDHTFQTGAVLARPFKNTSYEFLAAAWNTVVPYQTYAMHHGSSREQNFSPPGDLNHYDTNHAEVALMLEAGRQSLDLSGTTLFINLLPCPSCARMMSATGIAEIRYSLDHSAGYATSLLAAAGKHIHRA